MNIQNEGSVYTVFTDLVSSTPQVSVEEAKYGNALTPNAGRLMLCPVQKIVAVMRDIEQKLLNPDDIVSEALAEVLPVAIVPL